MFSPGTISLFLLAASISARATALEAWGTTGGAGMNAALRVGSAEGADPNEILRLSLKVPPGSTGIPADIDGTGVLAPAAGQGSFANRLSLAGQGGATWWAGFYAGLWHRQSVGMVYAESGGGWEVSRWPDAVFGGGYEWEITRRQRFEAFLRTPGGGGGFWPEDYYVRYRFRY